MGLKVYRSKTGIKYNLLLQKKDGRQVQIEFRGSNKEYRTVDTEIQKLIEDTKYFSDKKIELFQSVADDKIKDHTPVDEIVYTSVTTMQEAADVLIKNHKAKAKDVMTPEAIKSAAKGLRVSFPSVEFK
jgi:hypothetical protein